MKPSSMGLVIALCFAVRVAHADPVEHVVKTGDTCSSIAQHYYGDPRLVDVLHQANPALASKPPPHSLRAGMVLVIPAKPIGASAPAAKLTSVQNIVDVLTPETKRGKPNDPLFRGNRVSTQDASAADVTFRDETQVRLGERTLVIILGDARSAAARETETKLVTGNLRAFMGGKKSGAVKVGSDAATVRVFHGDARVSSDAVKTTRLAVYAGSSTIDARGRQREVTRGFGSKAVLGSEPTAPRPLPAAPIWSTRPDRVLVDRGAPLAIAGAYDLAGGSPRVTEWHVQVARDDDFRDVVADTKTAAGTRRLAITPPGPGHYFVHVSAIDDDRFEGPFGDAARVLVVRARTTEIGARRRVDIEPPDAACMRVGNVRLTWVKGSLDVGIREPVHLRCAPTASEPTTLITLDDRRP